MRSREGRGGEIGQGSHDRAEGITQEGESVIRLRVNVRDVAAGAECAALAAEE